MAHAQPLPSAALEHIARQIGERLAAPLPTTVANVHPAMPAPGAALSIAESFPIWSLGADAVRRYDEPFGLLARQTGVWHHQLRQGPGAAHIAKSVSKGPDPNDWHVVELAASPLGDKMEKAIEWIDGNVGGDPLARLLAAPAYFVTAFWLEEAGRDDIVVVDMPPSFTRLRYERIYPAREFLQLLSQEERVQGVPPQQPAGAP